MNYLRVIDIFARRYFYQLISNSDPYCELPSAVADNLTVATKVAQQVLCLPIYVELTEEDIQLICNTMVQ